MKSPNTPELLIKFWQISQDIEYRLSTELLNLGFYHPRAFFLLNMALKVPYPSKLAAALKLPPPTITFIIKQLEAKGFIKREVEKKDLRRYRLSITERGNMALENSHEIMKKISREIFNKFSLSEIEDFDKLVSILSTMK